MCDATAPAVAIGAAVGRIGCFLNGCCHGAVCELPWAVRFPAGSHAWVRQLNAGLLRPEDALSLPVHPTQLYSAAAGFSCSAVLLAYARRDRRPGEVMAVLMIALPADALADRGDPQRRAERLPGDVVVAEHQRRCCWWRAWARGVLVRAAEAIVIERGLRHAASPPTSSQTASSTHPTPEITTG